MKVNRLIKDIGDREWVHYADISQAFLNGRRMRGDLIPDGTHPNAMGYGRLGCSDGADFGQAHERSPDRPLK